VALAKNKNACFKDAAMPTAFSRLGNGLHNWLRGDAAPLSDGDISRTISFARITLIVGLVFLHYQAYPNSTLSPFVGFDSSRHQVATFVNSFVLFFFFSVVPLLSMVSGWLFFSFGNEDALAAMRRRIQRRFFSLYLPLVFWNALILIVLLLVFAKYPDYPLFRQLNIHFPSAGWLEYINAIFAVTRHPIAFQFWFVRDLFVTAMLSPLLWLALRRAPFIGMAVLGLAWMAGSGLGIFFRTDVVFFFYLGAFLRMRRLPLQVSARSAMILMGVYIALTALRALTPALLDLATSGPRPELLTAATRSMRLLGVVACWGIFVQIAATRLGAAVGRHGGLAFFLHSAHYPLLAVVKLVLWRWVPAQSDGWMIAHYLASVTVTVAIGLSTGLLLARLAPNWFALLNGGRLVSIGSARPVAVPTGTLDRAL
jgi:hypothetical protein